MLQHVPTVLQGIGILVSVAALFFGIIKWAQSNQKSYLESSFSKITKKVEDGHNSLSRDIESLRHELRHVENKVNNIELEVGRMGVKVDSLWSRHETKTKSS